MTEEELLQCVDEMVEVWGDILVPIYTDKEFRDGVAFLLGTGFLAEYREEIFLVTAQHVIKDHSDKLLVIGIGDTSVPLSKMPFFASKENDLAVSRLEKEWADEAGVGKVKAIPLEDKKEGYISEGRYFLMGFPGKKNTLNKRIGKDTKNIHGTSFVSKIESPQSKTHIDCPVAFEFDKNSAINTDGQKTNPPSFSGNSGGPILQLMGKDINRDHKTIGCRLSGIFTGWHQNEKEAIAARPEALLELICRSVT
ncbi:serine protease [Marinobacter alexandrii]|uniref:trypsin-like peptidase domain-containing protein n=1 Tax=Marinobacter alexandrii TaxID=2570351 RepID=UPI001FFFC302|nr:trypsin-like peptidase domain-containing protein [Marinobacter alexandrii]MCK2149608.1 serine protease [Marinobacter alexandrii]